MVTESFISAWIRKLIGIFHPCTELHITIYILGLSKLVSHEIKEYPVLKSTCYENLRILNEIDEYKKYTRISTFHSSVNLSI